MAWRVIVQPDKRYAIFSEIVDCFEIMNLTRDEVLDECREKLGRHAAEKKVQRAEADPDRWDEALDDIKRVHGAMHCRSVVAEPKHPGSHAAREEYERALRAANTACRRCSGCEGMAHHWIENEECEDESDPSYVCKHCDALGDSCDKCNGDGCRRCRNEGVVFLRLAKPGEFDGDEEGQP